MDIGAVRDRLKTRLEAIGNIANVGHLFVYDTMPGTPTVPCAIIAPATGEFLDTVTLDGAVDLRLTVTVLVTKVPEAVAQDTLDTYLSSGSAEIRAAIDAGETADWDYAISGSVRGYGQYTFGTGEAAQTFLGFEIPVTVAG